ncbi:hypothetical protein [Undibacterium sp. SXout20W]|uniref:hypothetical protein n=1 Tax=Undibacterium sp. SXout20W TaxID=3413051 RepID=UPI003BF3D828
MYLSSMPSNNANANNHFFDMPEIADARQPYFAKFEEKVEITAMTPTRMGRYQFTVVPFQAAKGILMEVERHGKRIISAHLPAIFSRGELLSASLRVRDTEYLLVAANSSSKIPASGKRWLGIFRDDGKNVYANVFEQQVVQVMPNEDGISMQFLNGDQMRIKL